MLTLLRVLIVWVLAALLARQILVGLRTGQLKYRLNYGQALIVKKRRQPLAFWAIAAVSLFLALAFFAIGAGILSGRI